MTYTRLYASDDGESHFEDIEIAFVQGKHVPSGPPLGLSEAWIATNSSFMEAPRGWESSWHISSTRNFFVVINGDWEVTASDGETRRFGPQSLLLVEDMTGKGHKSRVVSDSIAAMIELATD
jgi:hypothetical protein